MSPPCGGPFKMINTYSREDCLRKAIEFRAKAAAATDPNLKRSFELLAKEFDDRAQKIQADMTRL